MSAPARLWLLASMILIAPAAAWSQTDIPVPQVRPDETDDGSGGRSPAEIPGLIVEDEAASSDIDGLVEVEESGGSGEGEAEVPGLASGEPAVEPSAGEDVVEETTVPAVSTVPLPQEKPEQPADEDSPDAVSGSQDADDAATIPHEPVPSAPAATPAPEANSDLDTAPLGGSDASGGTGTTPDITPSASVRAAAAVASSVACEQELSRRGVEFTVGPTISEGRCGVLRPIQVTKLASGLTVSPATALWCPAARALDSWATQAVLPAAKKELPDSELTAIRHASTYVCRDRGSGTKISEHARGSGFDVSAFVFADREIGVEAQAPGSAEARFQKAAREGACGPFTTVLGPGTDADHATHFHFDMAARRGPYCR